MITWLLMKLKGREYIFFIYFSILLIFGLSFICGLVWSIVIYILLFVLFYIYALFRIRRNNCFNTYFGVPGSGKSTFATYFAIEVFKQNKRNEKRNLNRFRKGKSLLPIKSVYCCNLSVKGAKTINKRDININNQDLHDCLLLIDESGISYNNRNFSKNFSEEELKLFKYHRKRNIDIIVFSQSYEDMDKKLRDLSTQLYFLKKSFIPFFIKSITIIKSIAIDKDTKQIIDAYSKIPFSGFYVYMPRTWKFFNTEEEQ